MNSIKVCEYSRSRSFYDDLILQDQASGERSQDQWSSGYASFFKFCIHLDSVQVYCVREKTRWLVLVIPFFFHFVVFPSVTPVY